jgi:hypothetical protein
VIAGGIGDDTLVGTADEINEAFSCANFSALFSI